MYILEKAAKAPDFSLRDQNKEKTSLSAFKGQKVLLSFHPLAWTPVCIDQMRSLERRYDEFDQKGVKVLGISIDPLPTKAVWAKSLGLEKLKILSDFFPLGSVAKSYGVFLEDHGMSGRANILIDEEGNVLWSKMYDIPVLPDLDEVLAQL